MIVVWGRVFFHLELSDVEGENPFHLFNVVDLGVSTIARHPDSWRRPVQTAVFADRDVAFFTSVEVI